MKQWIGLLFLVITLSSCQAPHPDPLGTYSTGEEQDSSSVFSDTEDGQSLHPTVEYLKDFRAEIRFGIISNEFLINANTGEHSYGVKSNAIKLGDYFLFMHAMSNEDRLYRLDYCKLDGTDYNTLLYSERKIIYINLLDTGILCLGLSPVTRKTPDDFELQEYVFCTVDLNKCAIKDIDIISLPSVIYPVYSNVIWNQNTPYFREWQYNEVNGVHSRNEAIYSIHETGQLELIQNNIRSSFFDDNNMYYQLIDDPILYAMDLSTRLPRNIISLDGDRWMFAADRNYICYNRTFSELIIYDIDLHKECFRYEEIGEVSYGSTGLLVTDKGFYITGSLPGDGGVLDYFSFEGYKKTLVEYQILDYFIESDWIYFIRYLPNSAPGKYNILGKVNNLDGELIWLA